MKIFLEAFRPVFIRKPLTNLSYLVKFWERKGNVRKFSEALAEMFGNFRKLSEAFRRNGRVRRRREVQVRARGRGKAHIQSVSPRVASDAGASRSMTVPVDRNLF
jgi:hypothetical protein